MHTIRINLGYFSDHAVFTVAKVKDLERIFMMVLQLSDKMPEKLRFLDAYGKFFRDNPNSRRDIDN